jgi:hypothetical protein
MPLVAISTSEAGDKIECEHSVIHHQVVPIAQRAVFANRLVDSVHLLPPSKLIERSVLNGMCAACNQRRRGILDLKPNLQQRMCNVGKHESVVCHGARPKRIRLYNTLS